MEPRRQRSIESYGQGQSGYTAGRVEGDRVLEEELEGRNAAYPCATEVQPDDPSTDDRWTGRGATPWVPTRQP